MSLQIQYGAFIDHEIKTSLQEVNFDAFSWKLSHGPLTTNREISENAKDKNRRCKKNAVGGNNRGRGSLICTIIISCLVYGAADVSNYVKEAFPDSADRS